MASSSNNRFATLSGLMMPLGKFVLERVSSGDKNAATGSNAIPVAMGNNKYANALKSKLPPNVQATSASHPSPSSLRRHLNFHLRRNLMFCPPRGLLPSKGQSRRCSLKQLKPVLPTGGTNFLPSSLTNSFGPPRTKR